MAWMPPPAIAGDISVAGFVRVELDPRPGWTVSGTWTPDGRELLLVDAFRSEILRYSTEGGLLTRTEVPYHGSTDLSRPSIIHPWGNGFLVEQEDADFVQLRSSLEVAGEVDVLEMGRKPSAAIASVFGWVPMGDSLITLSDIRLDSGKWETAFLRIPLGEPAHFEVLHSLEGDPEALGFYLLGQPYLTSLGENAYFLLMSDSPTIFEVSGGSRQGITVEPLAAFPRDFLSRPLLPEQAELNQIPALFEGVERSHMAAGLYGWGDHLFVLTRRPAGVSNRTRWSLTKIDPHQDKVVGTFVLPTAAAHLTVIPGPEMWGFLEKGPVRGFGQQDTSTLLLIPSSVFDG